MYLKLFLSLMVVGVSFSVASENINSTELLVPNFTQMNEQHLTQQRAIPSAPKKPRFVEAIHNIDGVLTLCREEYRYNPQLDVHGNYSSNERLHAIHAQPVQNPGVGRVLNFE